MPRHLALCLSLCACPAPRGEFIVPDQDFGPIVDCGDGGAAEGLARLVDGQLSAVFTPGDPANWHFVDAGLVAGATLVDESLSPSEAAFELVPDSPDVRVQLAMSLDCGEGDTGLVLTEFRILPSQIGESWEVVSPWDF